MQKTNAMRLLDKAKIAYSVAQYDYDESDLSGTTAAKKLGLPMENVFKTLVAKGESTGIMVCIIPVDSELNLKAIAAYTQDKKIEMIPVKDLQRLTGYIRGGCSPLAMKKSYPTYMDSSALLVDTISISAGMRGLQILVEPMSLIEYIGAEIFDCC